MMPQEPAIEPCQYPGQMGKHACENRHQCWEPCGELGHDERYARRAPDGPVYAVIDQRQPQAEKDGTLHGESACTLTDAELADPEFVRAYIEGCNDSFALAMRAIANLRLTAQQAPAELRQLSDGQIGGIAREFGIEVTPELINFAGKVRAHTGGRRGGQVRDSDQAATRISLCEHKWELQPGTASKAITERCQSCCIVREVAVATAQRQPQVEDAKKTGTFTNAEDLFVAIGVGDFVWASVKVKLPSGPGYFLVTDCNLESQPWVHRFTAQGKFYGNREITHWMPLPAPANHN